MVSLRTLLRAAPLSSVLFLMAANSNSCNINIINGDGSTGSEDCVDLSRACPDLSCPEGFAVDDEGCAICQCAPAPCQLDANVAPPVCDDGSAPIFDEGVCAFVCGTPAPGCGSDLDCLPGQHCEIGGTTTSGGSAGSSDAAPPDGRFAAPGICVDNRDCGDGTPITCDALPPVCPPGSATFRQNGCYSPCLDVTTCELAPQPGVCSSDIECGPGARCVDGACLPPTPCSDDTACGPDERCAFDAQSGGAARPCNVNDPNCSGLVPPPPAGICVPVERRCSVDSECNTGDVCRTETVCGGCENACEVDATTGEVVCHPCDPVCWQEGRCAPADGSCANDTECGRGQFCALTASCPACDCPAGSTTCVCPDAPCTLSGVCVDVDPGCPLLCGPGATCTIDRNGAPTCQPIATPCGSDLECSSGEHCNAADVCLPPPGCTASDTDPACATVCTGFCVANERVPCTDDGACAATEYCNATELCLPPPECANLPPGSVCADVCTGFCVAR